MRLFLLLAILPLAACHGGSDACQAGDRPVVQIGAGLSQYRALDAGDSVAVDRGPQGGQHLTLALKATGLPTGRRVPLVMRAYADGEEVGGSSQLTVFRCDRPLEASFSLNNLLVLDAPWWGFRPRPLDVTVEVQREGDDPVTASLSIYADDPSYDPPDTAVE